VLRVDVGMSAGCGGSRPEVLEILRDGAGGISRLRLDERTGAVVREPVAGAGVPAAFNHRRRGGGGSSGMMGSYYSSLFGGGGKASKSSPVAAA
jgi:hypothetical protein